MIVIKKTKCVTLPPMEVFYVDADEAEWNQWAVANGSLDHLEYCVPERAGWYWWSFASPADRLHFEDPVGPFDEEDDAKADAVARHL